MLPAIKKMKELFLKIERIVYRKTFREIEELITEIINESEGESEESIKKVIDKKEIKINTKWGKYLFRIYNKPPECPHSIKVKLNVHSKGENWEYYWSKACFGLLSKLPLNRHIKRLKRVIKENHIWFSCDAMNTIVCYESFFENQLNIEFVKNAIQMKGDWAGLIYLKSISKLESKPLVNRLVANIIKERLNRKNQQGYLHAFHIIRNAVKDNISIRKEYSYYLLDVVNSPSLVEENKYSEEFKFSSELRARSLINYITLYPTDENANIILKNWLDNEDMEPVRNILTRKNS